MWTFAQVVEGMAEACRLLGTPVTGGNVSFYNETLGTAVYPTPVIGAVGILDDVTRRLTQWFEKEGDVILLLGPQREELDGSEYLSSVCGLVRGRPTIDLQMERALQGLLIEANSTGLLRSAHDVTDGGLAVALAEACFRRSGQLLGCDISLLEVARPDAALFGEAPSRVVVSCAPEDVKSLEELAGGAGVPIAALGAVCSGRIVVRGPAGEALISVETAEALRAWESGVSSFFERHGPGPK